MIKSLMIKSNNFLRFAMDNFDTELVVMGIKLAPITQFCYSLDLMKFNVLMNSVIDLANISVPQQV